MRGSCPVEAVRLAHGLKALSRLVPRAVLGLCVRPETPSKGRTVWRWPRAPPFPSLRTGFDGVSG